MVCGSSVMARPLLVRAKIPLLLRCLPVQAITISLFGIAAFIGMLSQNERVLYDNGYYQLKSPWFDIFVIALLSAFLFCISYIIKPLRVRLEFRPRARHVGFTMSAIYILLSLGLLIYNWWRLDAWSLLFSNPGAIAFQFSEKHGAVLLYTTMLCFFIGVAFILDHSKGRYMRLLIVGITLIFAFGLLGLTRREMLILLLFWQVVYFSVCGGKLSRKMLLLLGILSFAALYVSMLFRGIDVLYDPTSYFASGEFEPFRYALYLVEKWSGDPHILAPWSYIFPFVGDHGPIGSVNGYFSSQILGESDPLGQSTVTIFTTMLYFGFVFPVFFYVASVFFVKQSGYWLEQRPSFYSSFLYSFFLLRLFLFIRNGELLASLIDTIVLVFFVILFHVAVGWRCVID